LGDCVVLLSEDMQHGLDMNGKRIVNPFMPDAPSRG
jgi:predicted nucleic acid-binding protein